LPPAFVPGVSLRAFLADAGRLRNPSVPARTSPANVLLPLSTQASEAPSLFQTTLYVVGAAPRGLMYACTTHGPDTRISWERVRKVSADQTCGFVLPAPVPESSLDFKIASGSRGSLTPSTASLRALCKFLLSCCGVTCTSAKGHPLALDECCPCYIESYRPVAARPATDAMTWGLTRESAIKKGGSQAAWLPRLSAAPMSRLSPNELVPPRDLTSRADCGEVLRPIKIPRLNVTALEGLCRCVPGF